MSTKLKILLVSDTWNPHVNGVVNTMNNVIERIQDADFYILSPFSEEVKTYKFDIYSDVKLVKNPLKAVKRTVKNYQPDRIHLVTEGPLGLAARAYCKKKKLQYTSAFHSRFDVYLKNVYHIPDAIPIAFLKWFHRRSQAVLVPTQSIHDLLSEQGFKNLKVWSRGVNIERFYRKKEASLPAKGEKPSLVMVARASKEKNIDDFCKIKDYPKTFIGDGPYLKDLKSKYPDVNYTGKIENTELIHELNKHHIFVFPSRFDTFGIVMLEAMACGLPVAGFPVHGPIDVIEQGVTGIFDEDLQVAVDKISENLAEYSKNSLEQAKKNSWENCAEVFLKTVTKP